MKTSYQERDYAFGQVILTLRVAIGLTQERLGSLLGVSARSVAGWEGGSTYPKTKHLKTLIELAVQRQAFPKDAAAEEIRRLWKASGQKVLLDEDWLSALLSQQSYRSSAVEPEAGEETRSCAPPPLPNGKAELDREIQRTADSSGQAVGTRTGINHCPYGPCPANRNRADLWQEAQGHNEALDQHEVSPKGNPCPPLHKTRERRKWLLLSLITLVMLTIIGSAGTLFFLTRNGTATQENKMQAYPGYLPGKGTLAFFDPLSQERGSQWRSNSDTCQFVGGAYHVSQQQMNGSFTSCWAYAWFSNFALEIQVTITQGDCGGIVFRYNGNGNYYYFLFCQDGTYWLSQYVNGLHAKVLYVGKSFVLHTGLGQQNTIAVVASGSTMTIYANEQQIAQTQDSSYTLGGIALAADPTLRHVTEVVYSNARLWTL